MNGEASSKPHAEHLRKIRQILAVLPLQLMSRRSTVGIVRKLGLLSEFPLAIAAAYCIYVVSTSRRRVMIVEFRKWGNSLAVRIPKALADIIKVSDGKRAEIKIENGALVLRPIVKPARKPSYTLD